MKKKIIIYSHGFGVRSDDRGLFSDIKNVLPEFEHVTFDYTFVDEVHNTMVQPSLDQQSAKLNEVILKMRSENPDAEFYLICHSMGSLVGAVASPNEFIKTILLAPLQILDKHMMIKKFGNRKGAHADMHGVTTFPRPDGSTTIIHPEFWSSFDGVDPKKVYGKLGEKTRLTIIRAKQDKLLLETNFDDLKPQVEIFEIDGGHDFGGHARKHVAEVIKDILAK